MIVQRVQAVGDRLQSLSPVLKLLRTGRLSSVVTFCLVQICTAVATVSGAHPGGSISTSRTQSTGRPGSATIVKSSPSCGPPLWYTRASQLRHYVLSWGVTPRNCHRRLLLCLCHTTTNWKPCEPTCCIASGTLSACHRDAPKEKIQIEQQMEFVNDLILKLVLILDNNSGS